MLLMLMVWAVTQMLSLTILSFHCVVKLSFSCKIPMVSAAHWMTPTLVSGPKHSSIVGNRIEFAFVTTDFGNPKAAD